MTSGRNGKRTTRILAAKAEQCPGLRTALEQTDDQLIAYVSPDHLLGSGLSLHATTHTNPDSWVGRNIVGYMLMELRAQLRQGSGNTELEQTLIMRPIESLKPTKPAEPSIRAQ